MERLISNFWDVPLKKQSTIMNGTIIIKVPRLVSLACTLWHPYSVLQCWNNYNTIKLQFCEWSLLCYHRTMLYNYVTLESKELSVFAFNKRKMLHHETSPARFVTFLDFHHKLLLCYWLFYNRWTMIHGPRLGDWCSFAQTHLSLHCLQMQ